MKKTNNDQGQQDKSKDLEILLAKFERTRKNLEKVINKPKKA